MMDRSPMKVYEDLIQKHNAFLKTLLQKRILLGWLRFIAFIAMIIVSYKIFVDYGWVGLIPALLGAGSFIYVIFLDTDNNEKINNTKTLIRINEEELKILSNVYLHREDGSQFSPTIHDYANDLDLLGQASIFQLTNRSFSEQGKKLFANNLLHPLPIEKIEKRQEAVKELTPAIEWRQQFQAFSEQTILTTATEQKTNTWLGEEEKYFC